MIGLDATVNDLSTLLGSLRITPDSEVAIIDETGKVIAYPDVSRLVVREDNSYEAASGLPSFNSYSGTYRRG